ncbi:MAG: hypothetical protein M3P30_10690 [Chloroflexota bacterium]|nr:hypothetical protein [Chloroflexota bacterium]
MLAPRRIVQVFLVRDGEHREQAGPEYAAMFREMRADCAIVRAMMRDNKR